MESLKPYAKPWSPRNRLEEQVKEQEQEQEIPSPFQVTLQDPPKLPRPTPYLAAAMMAREKEKGKEMVPQRDLSRVRLIPIEEIEQRYTYDPFDGHRRNYAEYRLDEIALYVFEDMKSFEVGARRIWALPADSFYQIQAFRYMIDEKYQYYQRTIHHIVMCKVRTLIEYYMREFANAYNDEFIGWFNHLQAYLTESEQVKFPYMMHFHERSFNQFIYRDLMELVLKLRERIMRSDRHMISPIPSEFILNSHYNNIRHMINEEQFQYILCNLHKMYRGYNLLMDKKISYE